ncbi:MAG: PAS domain-containing protein [Pseudomonadota bacterium]
MTLMWPFRNLHWHVARSRAICYGAITGETGDTLSKDKSSGFRAHLPHPHFVQLLDYWCDKRGESVPRKSEIDPLDIPALLPFIQIHARQADGRYLCRLSGTAIVEALAMETTGQYLDEILPPHHLKSRTAILDRCLKRGLPSFYSGRLAMPGREFLPFHRLVLPLRNSAEKADCVLTFSMVDLLANDGMDATPPAGIAYRIDANAQDLVARKATPVLS